MIQIWCKCSNGLTEHVYGTKLTTLEDGYQCEKCGNFEPLEDDFEEDE